MVVGGAINGNPKHIDDLDISPAEDGYIIYQAELDRVHFLNPTAVVILEFCNGRNSPEEIVEVVREAYGLQEAPVLEVQDALLKLKVEGLLM